VFLLLKNSLVFNKSPFVRQTIISTLSQVVGRSVNVAIPFVVVFLYGAGENVDYLFLALSVSFYFYGSLGNVINDTLSARQLSSGDRLSRFYAIQLSVISLIATILILYVFNMEELYRYWVVAVFAGILSALGLLASLWVPQLVVRRDFHTAGFSWLWRLFAIMVFLPIYDPEFSSVGIFILCIVVGDSFRLIHLAFVTNLSGHKHGGYLGLPQVLSFLPYVAGTLLQGLNPVVDRLLASMGADGSITILEMADRSFWSIAAVTTIGLQSVLLVDMGRRHKSGALNAQYFTSLLKAGFGLGVVASLGLLLLGLVFIYWGVGDLFNKLSVEQVQLIFECVILYSLAMPIYVAATICSRIFIVYEKYSLLLHLSLMSVVSNIAVSYPLYLILGLKGVVWGTVVSMTLTGILCFRWARKIIN